MRAKLMPAPDAPTMECILELAGERFAISPADAVNVLTVLQRAKRVTYRYDRDAGYVYWIQPDTTDKRIRAEVHMLMVHPVEPPLPTDEQEAA
jgi:hypothetical protein